MEKRPVRPVRRSYDLIEAIKKARKEHAEAQQSCEKGKWVIKDGEAILAGPSASQWDAWMEAAYGRKP